MTTQAQFLSDVAHIMDVHLTIVSADTPAYQARSIIEANNGEPAAVLSSDGKFKGVLTSDALMVDGPFTAGDLASRVRMTVAPHESAFSVISRMLSRRVDWVPVLKNGTLVGSLTRRSVLTAYGELRSV
ncbi:MAG: CBS domain-containing protein [Chloroflexi bacterium]|nr:CBS domain-containing protein [Chloroflexota bacterium]